MIYNFKNKRDRSKVLFLEKQCGFKIGKRIYAQNGAWLFISGNYVVKVYQTNSYYTFDKIKPVLEWVAATKPKNVTKVFNYGNFFLEGQEYYFYVMEQLNKLPETYDQELVGIVSSYGLLSDQESFKLLAPKVRNFVRAYSHAKFAYHDLHEGNIMIDKRGTLKFVDLEGFRKR